MTTTLFYIHDPMCSWCWAFRPTLESLLAGLQPDIQVVRLLGGLAPDTDAPMSPEMRLHLQQTWHRIQHRVPGTKFNFDFWTHCEPRRSTYPACRAVIAARRQNAAFDEAMTFAIQRAYYLEARNPSESETLTALAADIGADVDVFATALDAPDTRAQLASEIEQAHALGVDSFPALVLTRGNSRWRVPIDYTDAAAMLTLIHELA